MRAAGVAQGLLLAGLGAFMIALALSSQYWYFLNPKFAWLTLATGAALMLLGPAAAAGRVRAGGLEAAAMAAVLAVGLTAWSGAAVPSAPPGLTGAENPESPEPYMEHAGEKYLKINAAELLMLVKGKPGSEGGRFVLRGMYKRHPRDPKAFFLVRPYIVCCFADAVAMSIPVLSEEASDYPDGQWLRVFGELVRDFSLSEAAMAVEIPGVLAVLAPEDAVLRAVKVEAADPPTMPYIFETAKEPPYNY
jgi:hypothetical protein